MPCVIFPGRNYFLRPPGRCERAEPAAVFELFDVRPSRNTFEAAFAAPLPVTLLRAIGYHRLPDPDGSMNFRLSIPVLQQYSTGFGLNFVSDLKLDIVSLST